MPYHGLHEPSKVGPIPQLFAPCCLGLFAVGMAIAAATRSPPAAKQLLHAPAQQVAVASAHARGLHRAHLPPRVILAASWATVPFSNVPLDVAPQRVTLKPRQGAFGETSPPYTVRVCLTTAVALRVGCGIRLCRQTLLGREENPRLLLAPMTMAAVTGVPFSLPRLGVM